MEHNHKHEHCDCHEEHHHEHEHLEHLKHHEHEHHEHHGHEHHEHGHHHEHHHEGHHHHHEEGGVKETAIKIGVATVLLIAAFIIEKNTQLPTWAYLLIYLVPYLVVGWETLKEAFEGLMHGEALSEDFLMSVATLGALGIGFMPGAESQFPEAVFVMLFFQLGEMFEGIAEGRSRKSIGHLMDIRPDVAHVDAGPDESGAPRIEDRHPAEIPIGTIIIVRPGEKVPLDGIVLEGSSSIDTVALTGESVPRGVSINDEILSGCVNLNGVLKVKTTKAFGESTASKILELVEHATEHKSRSESFITKFAKVYTPIVVALALIVAIVPSLITGDWATWVYRGLMFLVVSCPCALVISVPLSFFGGIGGASRKGILIKGANLMDTLRSIKTVVFDKTGTLTEGVFEVSAVHPDIIDPTELLHLAAHVERHSTHPIAMALRNAYPDEADDCSISGIEEIAGQGATAQVNGRRVAVGNSKLMESERAAWHPCHHDGTIVHVSIDGEYAGHIVISDRIKADAADAIQALREAGVRRTVMLTGDQESVAAVVAAEVGVDDFRASLLPADKVAQLEDELSRLRPAGSAVISTKQSARRDLGAVAFVGDGINDAPVLARADVGIAMGALGSDAAIEAADVVLMDDKPSSLATAIRIARRTVRIATENIWFAVGVKVLVLVLAALGVATMWMAVFADVGVTVLAVLNAMRALRLPAAVVRKM